VPARKGSKGFKNKNFIKINGIPIVKKAAKIGTSINMINYTVISSDSKKILNLTEDNKRIIKLKRSSKIAKDNTPMLPVLIDAIKFVEKQIGKIVHYLIILDPTSPLRKSSDIKNAMKIFERKNLDLLISVNESDHNPYFSMLEKQNRYYSLPKDSTMNIGSRQQAKKVFNINTLVWIYSRYAIMKIKKRIPSKTDIMITSEDRSTEINKKTDWIKIKNYLKNKKI